MKDVRETREKQDSVSPATDVTELPCFDELVLMAREQPEELEEIRQNITREVIESAPEHMQGRLNGLQFRIDMERERSSNALACCLKLSQMMNDSLLQLREVLSNPEEYLRNQTSQQSAVVLSFAEARERRNLS